MYAKEYVRKRILGKKGDRREKFYLANAAGMLCFFLVAVLIAPITHEFGHLMVLQAYGCYYDINIVFDISGLHGFIDPLCALSERKETLLYSSGVLSNILIATMLFLSVSILHRKGLLNHANFLMYAALGFLSDPLFYSFAIEGDLVYVLENMEGLAWLPYLQVMGLLIFALSIVYVYFHLESFLEDEVRIEHEILKAESFIKGIKA